MKKTVTLFALVLVLSTSVIAGTLAMYTTSIETLAQGSVVAKEFILTKGGTDTFAENVKIAPAETVSWQFSVKNFNGTTVSETGMALDFNVDVTAADGKSAILPLNTKVTDETGAVVGTVAGNGKIKFADEFALNTVGQEKTYTVTMNWPSNNATDINYAGGNFGTALKVSVTGTQK